MRGSPDPHCQEWIEGCLTEDFEEACKLMFDECEVHCENLVGDREGRDLQQIFSGRELGRINSCLVTSCLNKI